MDKRIAYILLAVAAGAVMLATAALAQTPNDNQIVIPWGNWLGDVAMFIGASAAAFVTFALRALPAQWAAMAKTARVDQLLERAIQYGANTVQGATKDKEMPVPIANDVLEMALEYALANGPKALLGWVGGEEGLRQKIIARLNVAAEGAIAP